MANDTLDEMIKLISSQQLNENEIENEIKAEN